MTAQVRGPTTTRAHTRAAITTSTPTSTAKSGKHQSTQRVGLIAERVTLGEVPQPRCPQHPDVKPVVQDEIDPGCLDWGHTTAANIS